MIPQFQISTETGAADKKCGEASLRLLAQAGFTCVDYSPAMNGYQAFKGLYTFSDSDFKSFFVREKERAQNAGIQIGQIHAPYNPPPDTLTGEELAFFVRAVKRAIYACHLLGSPYVVIHPVIFPDWQEAPDYSYEMNAQLMKAYAEIAEQYQVHLAVENMPGLGVPYSDSADLLELLRTVSSPCLAVCLDTGHAHMSMPEGKTVADMARELGSAVKVLHVHDNDATFDQHRCPYMGTIDWQAFMTALKEMCYAGTLSLETGFADVLPASLQLPAYRFLYETASDLCSLL